jgi:hypothetical protein
MKNDGDKKPYNEFDRLDQRSSMYFARAVIRTAQRPGYDALRQQMQKQLAISAKRLQLELDSLALVHKLRIQEEFSFLSTLWKKKMSALSSEFQKAMAREARFIQTEPRVLFHPEFKEALKDAQQFVFEQSIFFPAPIVKVADALLLHPEMAGLHLIREPRDLLGAETLYHAPFEEDKAKLHWLIRKHLKGKELPDN